MISEYRDHFFCAEHKPLVPEGFHSGRNFQPVKCEQPNCQEIAEVVVCPKPLNYPKLRSA